MSKVSPLIFSLTQSEIKAVAAIVGIDNVGCVEEAILLFSYDKQFYKDRPNIYKLNDKCFKIQEYISALTELLSDLQLRDYLFIIAADSFRDVGGRQFIGKRKLFVNKNKTPMLHGFDIEALEKLNKVCETAINKQKPGAGRPKGQKDEAVHSLLNRLCQCCERVSNEPLTTKPGNILKQLIDILKIPLSLGELSGLTKKIITERNKKLKQS